jgi:ketosteroid isomerase-like protein
MLGFGASAAAGERPDRAELEDQLRATEVAFAKTMADRNHKAFAGFLDPETTFFGGHGEIRGKEAVANAWEPFFDAETAPFSWAPEVVAVLDSGDLGLTSGPIFAPDGRRIGTFNSVWRLTSDGTWKIVFDRGCPDCECPPSDPAR